MDIGGENIPNIKIFYALIVLLAIAGGFIIIVQNFVPSLMLWVDTIGFLVVMLGFLALFYTMYLYGYEEGFRNGKTESKKVHLNGYEKV